MFSATVSTNFWEQNSKYLARISLSNWFCILQCTTFLHLLKLMKSVHVIKLFCVEKNLEKNYSQQTITHLMLMSAKLNAAPCFVSDKNVGGRTIYKPWLWRFIATEWTLLFNALQFLHQVRVQFIMAKIKVFVTFQRRQSQKS